MVGVSERNQQKLELVNAGFSLKYIDEWQPKTSLYRHKPSYNIEGNVSQGIGTVIKGVPGNPDYVLRKARIGLFPWLPSDTCECQWCREKAVKAVKEKPKEEVKKEILTSQSETTVKLKCPNCDYIASGTSGVSATSSLRAHASVHK